MRFVRYFVMALVITVCCACAAFAYSPGDGYQDVTVSGSGSFFRPETSTGAFWLLREDLPLDLYERSDIVAMIYQGSTYANSVTVPADDLSLIFQSPPDYLFFQNNSGYASVSIPVSTPVFMYTSGVLSGSFSIYNRNVQKYSNEIILTFEFSNLDGEVVHTSSYTLSSTSVSNRTVSFAVDAPSDVLCSVSNVMIKYPSYAELDDVSYTSAGVSINELFLANGDISVDDLPVPEPPSGPEYGGSIGSFSVTTSPSGQYTYLMYYEDIVNGLYNAAIAAEAYSLAEYPYNTVMSYRGSDGYMYYVLIVTDHPFISTVEVAMEYINYGTYDYGFSSQVYICRVPLGSLTGGTYTFWAMSQYSAISAVEFLENLANSVPFPSADVTAADFYLSSPICALMSYEAGDPVLYTMGCNYAVAHQNTSGRVYLKQAFKFADSWAYLLLQAGNDGADVGRILNQILDTLRSSDGSSTVYIRLNQIYELLNNNTGLPADSPIVGAIDQSSATINTFMENDMLLPDMSEVGNLSAALTPVFDNIFSSLGVISVLTMIGLVLGVIKLVLQR